MTDKVNIKQDNSIFELNIYEGSYECSHAELQLVEPCCSAIGSSGYIECDCGGKREIVCNNPECTGLYEDFDDLLEKAIGGENECAS